MELTDDIKAQLPFIRKGDEDTIYRLLEEDVVKHYYRSERTLKATLILEKEADYMDWHNRMKADDKARYYFSNFTIRLWCAETLLKAIYRAL